MTTPFLDINECREAAITNTQLCSNTTQCLNLIGGFTCTCVDGFLNISGQCVGECVCVHVCVSECVCVLVCVCACCVGVCVCVVCVDVCVLVCVCVCVLVCVC